jgi:tRNA U34 5-carboxymethylaminomethyl modifying GTPase MnmE/TrmE
MSRVRLGRLSRRSGDIGRAVGVGELLKRGIRISLLGPPNAGKSSLLNVIVDREASIVSEEAGTTRDVVEVNVDIGGYLCVFADTAGLRSSAMIGGVEQEGIRRAKAKARDSDLVCLPLLNLRLFVDIASMSQMLWYFDPHC